MGKTTNDDARHQRPSSPGCCQPSHELMARAARGLERFFATLPRPNDVDGELPAGERPDGV